MTTDSPQLIPPHQFAIDGKVQLLKCVDKDRKSYGGFQWPTSGEVVAPEEWWGKLNEKPSDLILGWNPKPECGGGFHAWPWGLSVGDGKEPDYSAIWLVLEADPADIVDLGGKAKCRACNVIECGTYLECYMRIMKGQMAWTAQRISGAASNSGYSGAASNSGDRGAASNSGDSGAASNSGYSGIAVSTGEWSTVESCASGLIAVTAESVFWKITAGSVLCQRTEKGAWLLFADEWDIEPGETVLVEHGVIWKDWQ